MPETLNIWTVYERPKDLGVAFAARRFEMDKPTGEVIVADSLDLIRKALAEKGLVQLGRHPTDDPVIVETWL